jgi:Mn-containing catalase
MFMHNKRLMYTVRVAEPNPKLAQMMLEQFGGPQGELAAAMRYFTQGLAESDPKRKDMLMDIATEELSHLEVIGNIVVMLNSGVKASMAEGLEDGVLMSEMNQGGSSATSALLYGGGAPLTNSAGVPWTAAYVDSITDPTCDLRSNIAAESRAKIVYERLISLTDDPGIKEALGFLMTREIAHQKSFEKALYSIKENFPTGKMPGVPQYTDKYYNLSKGDGDSRGPWNEGKEWEYVTELGKMAPVDGGDGTASVKMSKQEMKLTQQVMARTASDASINPLTGADLGAKKDGSAGSTKNSPNLQ